MTKGTAIKIFKDIYSNEYDPEDKIMAIEEILDDEVISKCIIKSQVANALRWVMEEYL